MDEPHSDYISSQAQSKYNSDYLSLPGPHENVFPVPNVPYNYLASISSNHGLDLMSSPSCPRRRRS